MPAITMEDGRYITKASLAMRGGNQKIHKALHENGSLELRPKPFTYKELYDASHITPGAKATSFDGAHPRHVFLRDREGVEALSVMWHAIELTAVLPRQFDCLAAPLLRSKGAGLRDIALFHGLVRVCTRARKPHCTAQTHKNL